MARDRLSWMIFVALLFYVIFSFFFLLIEFYFYLIYDFLKIRLPDI